MITDYDMQGTERATATGVLRDASSLVVTAHPDPPTCPRRRRCCKPLDLERLLVQSVDPSRPRAGRAGHPAAEGEDGGGVLELVLYVSARSPRP